MNGIVFSIEEFSIYDGPGIRTTVFLKGCPLQCSWCHNPEGQSGKSEIVRSPNGCLHCGACEKYAVKKKRKNSLFRRKHPALSAKASSHFRRDVFCRRSD